MAIVHDCWVRCDRCGDLGGVGAISAREARQQVREWGWKRVYTQNKWGKNKGEDVCPRCQKREVTNGGE